MSEMAKIIPSAGQQLSSLQADVKTLLEPLHNQRSIKRETFFLKKVNKNQEKCQGLSAEKGKAVICMMILLRSGQKTKTKQGMSI